MELYVLIAILFLVAISIVISCVRIQKEIKRYENEQ